MSIEIWKPVVGFEGLYEVSDHGRVRSVDRYIDRRRKGGTHKAFCRGKVMSPGPHRGGYETITLHDAGAETCTTVHVLVAAAFIGPRPEGHQVCHNDGNRKNSRAANLRYGTPSENAADKHLHGTAAIGERSASAVLTERDVLEIRAARGAPQAELAARFGCTFSNISAIQRRVSWKHV